MMPIDRTLKIMKKKIVLWGSDENDKKVLLALELLAKENKVNLYSFPEEVATEEFYNKLMDDWREDKELVFPENHKLLERPLSVTEDLLPETIKVQRTDVVTRAKTEWHFAVLSTKLYDLYKSELEELKEKIGRLESFDANLFEELKSFWSKVAEQARDKNLFRDHADKLKEITNNLFAQLKEFKSKANEELKKISEENKARFAQQLDQIDEKIEKGLGLKPLFDELKSLQNEFKSTKFTREDRNSLWERIDASFKNFKAKKYGDNATDNNASSRLERRYKGLLSAIEKMEKSIARDEKDINFQNKRVDQTQGQLEMQIRQAKIKMIEERINSKRDKLNDMLKTKSELEKKLRKEEEKQKISNKKEELKAKIADEIHQKAEEMDQVADKLEEAAKAINKNPEETKEESMLEKIKTEIVETVEDVVDTVKAVSEVVEENVESKLEELKDKAEDLAEKHQVKDKLEALKDKAEALAERVEEKLDDIGDKIKGEEE